MNNYSRCQFLFTFCLRVPSMNKNDYIQTYMCRYLLLLINNSQQRFKLSNISGRCSEMVFIFNIWHISNLDSLAERNFDIEKIFLKQF